MDPRTRLFLVACAGVLAICLEGAPALLVFTLLCGLPLVGMRVSAAWWRRGILAACTIVWGTALSQGLFYAEQPRVPLFQLGALSLWREGLLWGLAQSLRFVGLSLAGLSLAVSTPADRLHAALLRLGLPFGLALMAATALRFLPELGGELLAVRRARAARGRPAWRRSAWAWLRLELDLLRPVIARSWRRAQNLAESLDARGFDPLQARTARVPLRLRAIDGLVLVVAGLSTLAVASARLAYVLYTSDTLYIQGLRPLYGLVRAWG